VDLDSWRLARDPIAAVQGKLLHVPKSPASAEKSAFGTPLHRWHQGEVAAEQGHVAPHIETAGHVTLPKEKRQIRRRA
jgi:hypothetical protein